MGEAADILGLEGLRVLDVCETWQRVTVRAEHDQMPACEKCGLADQVTWWEPSNPVEIADTPLRGRPVTIMFSQDRFRCRRCNRAFTGRAEAFCTGQRHMTKRLHRFIEDRSFRFPRPQIALELGIGEDAVDEVVDPLVMRLFERHRFPTPRAIGMDDLHLNDRRYIVFTDAERGHAIGIIERARQSDHEVRGYTRSDGTYVAPHMQTNADSTKLDNYSTRGNTNPYTGREGTVNPYAQTQSNPYGTPTNYGYHN